MKYKMEEKEDKFNPSALSLLLLPLRNRHTLLGYEGYRPK